MSSLTSLSLFISIISMIVQVSEVGARMSDDMIFPKPQQNQPQTHVRQDKYLRHQHRTMHPDLAKLLEKKFNRLPGVCKRIRRRRIRILCNVEKYCSIEPEDKHGQICPCPRGSKCGRFFLRSL